MTCQILALEKKQTPFSMGYSGLGGTRENVGGGGKNDSTNVADFAILSSVLLGRLLVVVCSVGTHALE